MSRRWTRYHALGLDPLELRLRNVYRDGDVAATGQPLETVALAECLHQVAQAVDWGAPLPPAAAASPASPRRPPRSQLLAPPSRSTRTATSTCAAGGLEIGTGAHTTLAQICAEALGLPVDA